MTHGAMAEAKGLTEVKFTIGQPKYTVGDTVKDMDAIPYIKDGRTMLPIKYIGEVLGVEEKNIEWNPAKQTVTIFKEDGIVEMTVGSKRMMINGKEKEMDAPAELKGFRTMLPLTHVAELFGAKVQWNPEEKTVTILKEEETKEAQEEAKLAWDYDYDQLVEKALKNSKDLRKAQMLVDKAEELKDDAVDKFKTTHTIPTTWANADKKNLIYRDLRNQQVAMTKAEKDVEVAKETIAYKVRTTYDALLKAQKNKNLAEQALGLKQELMKHTQLRNKQQMVSEIETNRAKRDYEEAKKNYEMSVKALDLAYEELNYLVGFKPEERYTIEDKIEFVEIPEIDLNLNSHISRMLEKSPHIWALEQNIDLGQLGLDLFVFNVDGDYEATKIDVETTRIDLSNLKQAYEENLRKLYTSLDVLQKQYEATMFAYEKAQDDLKVAKLNIAVGNGIPIEMKAANLKVEELKNKLDEIVIDYNDKATLYQKPWLVIK